MIPTVGTPALWAGFVALVVALLLLDLGIFHRRDRVLSVGAALGWTAVWAALSLAFAAFVWWRFGEDRAAEYLAGYVIEQSLSIDNLFVFLLLFGSFGVPPPLQHRVLHWGILTAIVLRAAMILAGTALVARFTWILYGFGAFLIFTGGKLLLRGEEAEEADLEGNRAFRLLRRLVPATHRFHGRHFVVVEAGRRVATPLLLCLVMVELSDVVFALDSVPAVFGVTLDPFIVFTSNIFAILGLRSLFFALARMVDRFHRLEHGVALVLLFVGGKMVASRWVEIGRWTSLGVVVALLAGAVAASIAWPAADRAGPGAPPAGPGA